MAQLPWTVVRKTPVSFAKARSLAERCSNEISQFLVNHANKTRIASLLQAFVESLEECQNNEYINTTYKDVPCVASIKALGVVQIHPSFLGNPLKGVYAYLSNFLMQYNEDIGGIWLTCGKITQLDQYGYVTDGDCFGILSLRVTVKLLVFIPQTGLMCGKTTRAMSDRASLLVYGMFGVTVRANEGLSDKTSKLSEGDLVEVDVTDVKVLQKNKWVMMSTTMDRITVIS